MKDLAHMSLTDTVVLPTLRDSLKVKVEEEAGRKYCFVEATYMSTKKMCLFKFN